MDRALAERLVCPDCHPRSPLVVRVDAADGGRLAAGVAGCPVCGAAWTLRADRVTFGPADPADPADRADPDDRDDRDALTADPAGATADQATVPALDADALAALLALADPGLCVWLDGVALDVVRALQRATGAQPVLADAAVSVLGAVHVDGARTVPFSAGTFVGACLLRAARPADYVDSVVGVLSVGGRLVALDAYRLPAGVRELARAGGIWVAERTAQQAPIPLRRA